MKRFILAFQFLTIIPIRTSGAVSSRDLAASMAYFPVVGAFQGGVLYVLLRLLSLRGGLLPDFVVAGVLLFVLTLTNGGLHLDGFADTVDGMAGGHTPADRLRIMKDSSTGAVGMVFLMLIILLKYLALLGALGLSGGAAGAPGALVFLFPVAARWAVVPLANLAPYARKEGGLGEAFAEGGGRALAVSTAIAFVLAFVAGGLYCVAPLFVLLFAAYVSSRYFRSRLGGVTGDVFGFQSEVSEAIFLLSAPVFLKLLPSFV
ncbi:MAG: adenosylcobinamide-GDP ribazoletransferase [Thermodesulfobacteriota bacterium]